MWLEFGVGSGKSLAFIAQQRSDQTIYGFDSFWGLPEDWALSSQRIYSKNTYSRDGIAPELAADNVELIVGLFSETLDDFCAAHTETCAFIRIDCDLYSSTLDVLNGLFKADKLISGTVILFEEFYNYPNYKDY
ncbi:class I SAM-dependent methyltransferase [Spirosoma soli]|uniref:Class I SAM-dependent methyltransferase n=1 Tax=Spirosoma soli TaxID=1770529 RepID=A0ABW5ME85_9BACT